MMTKVQKWGNSLALRIPKSFALDAKLNYNSTVDLSLIKSKIISSPITFPEYKLEGLLAEIKPKNVHQDIQTGSSIGKEL